MDPGIYSHNELKLTLNMVHEGNLKFGGLKKRLTFYGVVGFVKFLSCYYLIIITQIKEVGCIQGRFIYTIKETKLISLASTSEKITHIKEKSSGSPINTSSSQTKNSLEHIKNEKNKEILPSFYLSEEYIKNNALSDNILSLNDLDSFDDEDFSSASSSFSLNNIWKKIKSLGVSSAEIAENKYLNLFQLVDMTKDFFFSYEYDLTNSLQKNFLLAKRVKINKINKYNERIAATRSPSPSPSIPNTDNSTSLSPEIQACPDDSYIWNHFLLEEFSQVIDDSRLCGFWTLPIIHGSYEQKRICVSSLYLNNLKFSEDYLTPSISSSTSSKKLSEENKSSENDLNNEKLKAKQSENSVNSADFLDLILLARRSRHFAGTRYLKRGINVHGNVANDVEVEQIIQLNSTTKNYKKNLPGVYINNNKYDEDIDDDNDNDNDDDINENNNPNLKNYHQIDGNSFLFNNSHTIFSSYVQMRGSIPTYWQQETSLTQPKPPIVINRLDSDYKPTISHFQNLFQRYGYPIIVLDLIKLYEKRPRESLIGADFRDAIRVVNDLIDNPECKIRYIALDYSRISGVRKGKFIKKDAVEGREKYHDGNNTMALNQWAMLENNLSCRQNFPGNEENPQKDNYNVDSEGEGEDEGDEKENDNGFTSKKKQKESSDFDEDLDDEIEILDTNESTTMTSRNSLGLSNRNQLTSTNTLLNRGVKVKNSHNEPEMTAFDEQKKLSIRLMKNQIITSTLINSSTNVTSTNTTNSSSIVSSSSQLSNNSVYQSSTSITNASIIPSLNSNLSGFTRESRSNSISEGNSPPPSGSILATNLPNLVEPSNISAPSSYLSVGEIRELESKLDVLQELEGLASLTLSLTGFFLSNLSVLEQAEEKTKHLSCFSHDIDKKEEEKIPSYLWEGLHWGHTLYPPKKRRIRIGSCTCGEHYPTILHHSSFDKQNFSEEKKYHPNGTPNGKKWQSHPASSSSSTSACFSSPLFHCLDRFTSRENCASQEVMIQEGVLRTNCIDCLDRTNGGQFAVAMRVLIASLLYMGILKNKNSSSSSYRDEEYYSFLNSLQNGSHPIIKTLMEMYGTMGNNIALQYGGSLAHNKVLSNINNTNPSSTSSSNSSNSFFSTSTSNNNSSSQSSSKKTSELITSVKRYYSNAFTDRLKQDAINLFLGVYSPRKQQILLYQQQKFLFYHLIYNNSLISSSSSSNSPSYFSSFFSSKKDNKKSKKSDFLCYFFDSLPQLWDLDNDYHLHNRSLYPPPFLFYDLLKSSNNYSSSSSTMTKENSNSTNSSKNFSLNFFMLKILIERCLMYKMLIILYNKNIKYYYDYVKTEQKNKKLKINVINQNLSEDNRINQENEQEDEIDFLQCNLLGSFIQSIWHNQKDEHKSLILQKLPRGKHFIDYFDPATFLSSDTLSQLIQNTSDFTSSSNYSSTSNFSSSTSNNNLDSTFTQIKLFKCLEDYLGPSVVRIKIKKVLMNNNNNKLLKATVHIGLDSSANLRPVSRKQKSYDFSLKNESINTENNVEFDRFYHLRPSIEDIKLELENNVEFLNSININVDFLLKKYYIKYFDDETIKKFLFPEDNEVEAVAEEQIIDDKYSTSFLSTSLPSNISPVAATAAASFSSTAISSSYTPPSNFPSFPNESPKIAKKSFPNNKLEKIDSSITTDGLVTPNSPSSPSNLSPQISSPPTPQNKIDNIGVRKKAYIKKSQNDHSLYDFCLLFYQSVSKIVKFELKKLPRALQSSSRLLVKNLWWRNSLMKYYCDSTGGVNFNNLIEVTQPHFFQKLALTNYENEKENEQEKSDRIEEISPTSSFYKKNKRVENINNDEDHIKPNNPNSDNSTTSPYYIRNGKKNSKKKLNNILNRHTNNYYESFYMPNRLSEFDKILQRDFFQLIRYDTESLHTNQIIEQNQNSNKKTQFKIENDAEKINILDYTTISSEKIQQIIKDAELLPSNPIDFSPSDEFSCSLNNMPSVSSVISNSVKNFKPSISSSPSISSLLSTPVSDQFVINNKEIYSQFNPSIYLSSSHNSPTSFTIKSADKVNTKLKYSSSISDTSSSFTSYSTIKLYKDYVKKQLNPLVFLYEDLINEKNFLNQFNTVIDYNILAPTSSSSLRSNSKSDSDSTSKKNQKKDEKPNEKQSALYNLVAEYETHLNQFLPPDIDNVAAMSNYQKENFITQYIIDKNELLTLNNASQPSSSSLPASSTSSSSDSLNFSIFSAVENLSKQESQISSNSSLTYNIFQSSLLSSLHSGFHTSTSAKLNYSFYYCFVLLNERNLFKLSLNMEEKSQKSKLLQLFLTQLDQNSTEISLKNASSLVDCSLVASLNNSYEILHSLNPLTETQPLSSLCSSISASNNSSSSSLKSSINQNNNNMNNSTSIGYLNSTKDSDIICIQKQLNELKSKSFKHIKNIQHELFVYLASTASSSADPCFSPGFSLKRNKKKENEKEKKKIKNLIDSFDSTPSISISSPTSTPMSSTFSTPSPTPKTSFSYPTNSITTKASKKPRDSLKPLQFLSPYSSPTIPLSPTYLINHTNNFNNSFNFNNSTTITNTSELSESLVSNKINKEKSLKLLKTSVNNTAINSSSSNYFSSSNPNSVSSAVYNYKIRIFSLENNLKTLINTIVKDIFSYLKITNSYKNNVFLSSSSSSISSASINDHSLIHYYLYNFHYDSNLFDINYFYYLIRLIKKNYFLSYNLIEKYFYDGIKKNKLNELKKVKKNLNNSKDDDNDDDIDKTYSSFKNSLLYFNINNDLDDINNTTTNESNCLSDFLSSSNSSTSVMKREKLTKLISNYKKKNLTNENKKKIQTICDEQKKLIDKLSGESFSSEIYEPISTSFSSSSNIDDNPKGLSSSSFDTYENYYHNTGSPDSTPKCQLGIHVDGYLDEILNDYNLSEVDKSDFNFSTYLNALYEKEKKKKESIDEYIFPSSDPSLDPVSNSTSDYEKSQFAYNELLSLSSTLSSSSSNSATASTLSFYNPYTTSSLSSSLTSSQSNYDYEGFIKIAPDVFSKTTNPHLHMNEVSVFEFNRVLKNK